MSAKILRVKVWDDEPNTWEVVFDFDNDWHHSVTIRAGDDATEIASKLKRLALRLEHNDALR